MNRYQNGREIKEGDICAYSEMDGQGKMSYADSVGVITNGRYVSHCNRMGGDLSDFMMYIDENPAELSYHSTDNDGNIIDLVKLDINEEDISIDFAESYFIKLRDGILNAL